MAVTKYYTVNGMILGERIGNGAFRGYKTDALGSVIATTTSTGTIENTYRWKPFGGELAKTGTAADPDFGWNGGSGYRATGLTWSEEYVQSRHYATGPARWTTVDPLWPGESPYLYCGASPVACNDPSGLQALAIVVGLLTPGTQEVILGGLLIGSLVYLGAQIYDACHQPSAQTTTFPSNPQAKPVPLNPPYEGPIPMNPPFDMGRFWPQVRPTRRFIPWPLKNCQNCRCIFNECFHNTFPHGSDTWWDQQQQKCMWCKSRCITEGMGLVFTKHPDCMFWLWLTYTGIRP